MASIVRYARNCGCQRLLTVVSVGPRSSERSRTRPSACWSRPRWRCGAPRATPPRPSPTSARRRASPRRCSTSTSPARRTCSSRSGSCRPSRRTAPSTNCSASRTRSRAVIAAALTTFEQSMARNPKELVIETILEGYRHRAPHPRRRHSPRRRGRHVHRALHARQGRRQARADMDVETSRTSPYLASTFVSEGAQALGGRRVRRPIVRRRRHRRHHHPDQRIPHADPTKPDPARRPHVGFRDRPGVPGTAGLGGCIRARTRSSRST